MGGPFVFVFSEERAAVLWEWHQGLRHRGRATAAEQLLRPTGIRLAYAEERSCCWRKNRVGFKTLIGCSADGRCVPLLATYATLAKPFWPNLCSMVRFHCWVLERWLAYAGR